MFLAQGQCSMRDGTSCPLSAGYVSNVVWVAHYAFRTRCYFSVTIAKVDGREGSGQEQDALRLAVVSEPFQ